MTDLVPLLFGLTVALLVFVAGGLVIRLTGGDADLEAAERGGWDPADPIRWVRR